MGVICLYNLWRLWCVIGGLRRGIRIKNSIGGDFPIFASYGEPYTYGTLSLEFLGLIKVAIHGGYPCDLDKRSWGPGMALRTVDIRGLLESPPSFCNNLGTIYIASSRGRTFDLITKIWVQSLGTLLGRCKIPKIAQP